MTFAIGQSFNLSTRLNRDSKLTFHCSDTARDCSNPLICLLLVTMIASSGDATNSSCGAHPNKAHSYEIKTTWKHAPGPVDTPGDHSRVFFVDLAKVPLKCGGVDCRAMFLKQVSSAGAHTRLETEEVFRDFEIDPIPNHVHVEVRKYPM